jgi:hypothetical protein
MQINFCRVLTSERIADHTIYLAQLYHMFIIYIVKSKIFRHKIYEESLVLSDLSVIR